MLERLGALDLVKQNSRRFKQVALNQGESYCVSDIRFLQKHGGVVVASVLTRCLGQLQLGTATALCPESRAAGRELRLLLVVSCSLFQNSARSIRSSLCCRQALCLPDEQLCLLLSFTCHIPPCWHHLFL